MAEGTPAQVLYPVICTVMGLFDLNGKVQIAQGQFFQLVFYAGNDPDAQPRRLNTRVVP